MKLLHVAVFTPTSTNVWQADAFESLGHQVIRYDYRQRAKDLDGGINDVNSNRDDELISLCRAEHPDMILFSKCNKMDVRVVEECSKVGKTALWYMDPAGNINNELVLKMKTSHCIFSARWDGYTEGVKHNKNTFRIHEGFNPKTNYPMDIPPKRTVCFIGELRGERAQYHKEVYFDVVSNAYNEEHAKVVSETKVNLNFTEGDGTSDRTYKILAAKGFLLTQPWSRMEEDFTVGEDLVTFSSVEELRNKTWYYLESLDERLRIAEHGYNTVQKYSALNYAKTIMEKTINV